MCLLIVLIVENVCFGKYKKEGDGMVFLIDIVDKGVLCFSTCGKNWETPQGGFL